MTNTQVSYYDMTGNADTVGTLVFGYLNKNMHNIIQIKLSFSQRRIYIYIAIWDLSLFEALEIISLYMATTKQICVKTKKLFLRKAFITEICKVKVLFIRI